MPSVITTASADAGVDRLDHGALGELRRHEDDRGVGAGLAPSPRRRVLNTGSVAAVEVDLLAALAGGDAADDVGAGARASAGCAWSPRSRSCPAR